MRSAGLGHEASISGYRLQATRGEQDPELFHVPEDYQVSAFPEFKASPPLAHP
jgi:hypothetical protein